MLVVFLILDAKQEVPAGRRTELTRAGGLIEKVPSASLADMAACLNDLRFTPEADIATMIEISAKCHKQTFPKQKSDPVCFD